MTITVLPRGRYSALLAGFLFLAFLVETSGISFVFAQEEDPVKRADLEKQLGRLEEEANEINGHLQAVEGEKRTLSGDLSAIDVEVKSRKLEIRQTSLAIRRADLDIKSKTQGIESLSRKIDKNRRALASSLLILYTYDQDNLLAVLLKNRNLSDFFGSLHNLEKAQNTIDKSLDQFKDERQELAEKKEELEGFQEEQQDLKALQEVERRFLAQKKKEKEEILRLTRGKETIFQQLLKSKKKDIETLKSQLFYLEKTGIIAEDAIQFAELAAKRAGIRPAFLLALLEVETGKQFEDGVISVGTNLGTGNWKKDLYDCYVRLRKRNAAEAEKKAFFEITGKLGLDPESMPVSRKPNYGCGGAMGPAQFLPTTWLRFEAKVSELTGHNPPNPWGIEDAFTASAVFLASAGADLQTPAGETAAAKTYISGSAKCTKYICWTYSSRILSLAKDIDRIL